MKARNATDGRREAAAAASSLPCLYSNNSTELRGKSGAKDVLSDLRKLKGNHKRTAEALFENTRWLARLVGVQKLGFLTLTFADKVTCLKEAQRRYNSLLTHVLRPRYQYVIRVVERQKNGRIHYHLLIALEQDIRTGFDFEGIARRDYSSACKDLRSEWAFWRKTAPKYGFGRTELLPVKSTAEGIARYVGKYISKHIEGRLEEDKGARLVEYTKGARMQSTNFSFNTEGFRLWRMKIAAICECAGVGEGTAYTAFGKNWAYKHQDLVMSVVLKSYPTTRLEDLCGESMDHLTGKQALDFILETGSYRHTPESALVLIGLRNHEGKVQRFFLPGCPGYREPLNIDKDGDLIEDEIPDYPDLL